MRIVIDTHQIWQWFVDLFWYETGSYSVIQGTTYWTEKNLITGYSRMKDDWSGEETSSL